MITTEEQFNIDKINRHLPDDVILWAFTKAPPKFLPRYDVLMRHYRYYLDRSWANLNLGVVKETIALLIGSNDFSQLAKPDAGRNTITTILNISVQDDNGSFFLDIFGTRFLWKLVRKIVTLLTEIGSDRIKPSVIEEILAGQKVIPSGIQPAPPENLVLVESVVPFTMRTSKYATRIVRNQLKEQLEQYRRSIRTITNVIDFFSEPKMTSQHSTKRRNRSDSSD
jgi:tRNA pseudouridine38-40 synthase